MANWLVSRAGGSFLWGAYYYTGIGTGDSNDEDGQQSLARFLDMLETQPGFFVKRFPRKLRTLRCPHCQSLNRFTQEKEVDTTMVADILTLSAVGAFDILVLVSGDADHAPAMEGIRALGKQAYVATWGEGGLSSRLRHTAFDHIDLSEGLSEFATDQRHDGLSGSGDRDASRYRPVETPLPERYQEGSTDAIEVEEAFLRELRRAESKFEEGYVGVNYFLTRWQGDILEDSPEIRRRILDRLVRDEKVEIYTAIDGAQAIRELAEVQDRDDDAVEDYDEALITDPDDEETSWTDDEESE
jgi:uncharacterized LabA/DUF88 family protein